MKFGYNAQKIMLSIYLPCYRWMDAVDWRFSFAHIKGYGWKRRRRDTFGY